MTNYAPLWKLAEVNPVTPEFQSLDEGASVSFMPLETIWPGGRADYSRSINWSRKLSYTTFRRGDVLVPKITPTFEAGRSIIAQIPTGLGVASTEVHVVRTQPGVDSRFVTYALQSAPFLDEGAHSLQGVGNLRRITPRFVQEHRLLDVPREIQKCIADYLDRETGEIDAMLAKMDELTETLEARRQAAVDSAFAALGRTAPLWTLTEGVIDCPHTTPVVDELGEAEAVRTASVRAGKYVPGNGLRVSLATADERNGEFSPRPGDIFFTREAPAGEAATVPRGRFCLGQRMVLLRIDPQVTDSRFLLYALYTSEVQKIFLLSAGGSTVVNLKLGTIRGTQIPNAPLDEQIRIADYLDEVTGKIDQMLAKTAELKSLLIERRAALITDVVTGKKQVL